MAELPKLPERTLRLHSLRWNELIERHGFTGEHLEWHDSPDRRRGSARPRFSLAPPPITPVTNRTPTETTHFGMDGQPVPYEKWLQQQMEAWVRRESDPDTIDSIGVAETVTLAKARFSEVIVDYLRFWAASTDHNSDEFRDWSIAIAQLVAREMGDLWRKDQWHTTWFERACHKKIDEALGALTREWESRASKLEIQGLENPQLSIQSLLGSGGNLSVASTLEENKSTIETAQQVLSNLRARETLPRREADGKIRQHEKAGLRETQPGDDLAPEPSRVARVSGVSGIQTVRDTARELEALTQAGSQEPDTIRPGSAAKTVTVGPETIVVGESVHERSERRRSEVMPILASKRWKPNKWATKAGVSKNSVYEYLDGRRNLGTENRQALAEELGLTPEELPD